MEPAQDQFTTIDEYIDTFPADVQEKLQSLRQTIGDAAPEAQETIKYKMPTFTYYGNLVYFAAYKDHIGFYPTPSGVEESLKEMVYYKTGKGTLQCPIDQPLPLDLVRKVVEFRVKENLARKTKQKTKQKTKKT